jgi:hypothetical protein
MKRLLATIALTALALSLTGCSGGFGSLCRWNRGDCCDPCQNGGGYDGMVYGGVVDQGAIEDIPAGRSSTRD